MKGMGTYVLAVFGMLALLAGAAYIQISLFDECRSVHSLLYCLVRH